MTIYGVKTSSILDTRSPIIILNTKTAAQNVDINILKRNKKKLHGYTEEKIDVIAEKQTKIGVNNKETSCIVVIVRKGSNLLGLNIKKG